MINKCKEKEGRKEEKEKENHQPLGGPVFKRLKQETTEGRW